jgi:hypothetical protein
MLFDLFDYVNANGVNEFKKWTQDLQKPQRAKLNEKLDKLAQHGDDLHPNMLTDTSVPGIQKLRVKGNVQLRPLLCKGPVNIHSEYTLLMGAKEVGDKWLPKNAPTTADGKKSAVVANSTKRRKLHERVTG